MSGRWTRAALAASLVVLLTSCPAGCGIASVLPAPGGTANPAAGDTATPSNTVGPVGPVGPVARSCEGVAVAPTDDVQSVIDSQPPGTTFCLAAGVFRLTRPLQPRRGDALIGSLGTVVSGSKVLTGWRRQGATWSAPGHLPKEPGTHGECEAAEPACAQAEDVFLDARRLRRVDSAAAVTAGTVFADHRTNTVVIGDDPRSRLVEQAVAPSLVRATVDDVTVANLVLEKAANEAQTAAVEARQVTPPAAGSGWRIEHNEVRLNHGVGIGFAGGSLVTGNLVRDQGQLGFGAWGSGSTMTGNVIAGNGTAGYSPEWEAGGGKSWETTGLVLAHNHVHGNRGPGLWSDGGNQDTTYEYNRVEDNWGPGIQHEISYDARIVHNEVSRNGRRAKGWAWDAGIQIQSSGGLRLIEVAHNVVTDNANGITLLDSGRRAGERPAPFGPHVVRNVWVHDNVVMMLPGQTSGAVEDSGDPSIFTANHNRFDANTYRVTSLSEPHFRWLDGDLDWAGWRSSGSGNDADGRAEPAGR